MIATKNGEDLDVVMLNLNILEKEVICVRSGVEGRY